MVAFQQKNDAHDPDKRGELDRLSRRVKELETLNRIAALVGSPTDVANVLRQIVEEVRSSTNAALGSMSVVDENAPDGMTTLVRGEGTEDGDIACAVDRNITGWTLQNKKPLVIDDFSQDQRFSGLQGRNYGIETVLSVPLILKGEAVGSLTVCNKREGRFSEEDVRLVSIIASQSVQIIESARLYERVYRENIFLKREVNEKYRFDGIVGQSRAMRSVFALLDRILSSEVNVVVQGESGTGKELIAKAIHFNGPRREKPFIPIDCGAIPENLLESELFGYIKGAFTGATRDKPGLFQEANGGTLFLDEISNMGPMLQSKLLRVLQAREIRPLGSTRTHHVDVRIISASSSKLKTLVSQHSFREDLFFRLNVVAVDLPPLRQRREDIPYLVDHFFRKIGRSTGKKLKGFTPEAQRMLEHYDWPGNIRELENVIERSVTLASVQDEEIGPHLLPEEIREGRIFHPSPIQGKTLKDILQDVKYHLIADTMKKYDGNKTKVAKALGISRQGLLNMIRDSAMNDKDVDV